MKAEHQTEALKVRLYDLTLSFVRKYQSKYYKQYTGELDDLAMDFYCQFLTPKSRVLGKEETLLDKYDDTITSLEYLVKIAVRNMLIDRSRSNPGWSVSIDKFVDEHGDFMNGVFGLSVEQEDDDHVDTRIFAEDFIITAAARFDSLTEKAKGVVVKQYMEVKAILSPNYQELFDAVIKVAPKAPEPIKEELKLSVQVDGETVLAPVQQVTAKTVCCLVSGSIKEFNRITGEARGKAYKGLCLIEESLNSITDLGVYHSGLDRDKFLEVYC